MFECGRRKSGSGRTASSTGNDRACARDAPIVQTGGKDTPVVRFTARVAAGWGAGGGAGRESRGGASVPGDRIRCQDVPCGGGAGRHGTAAVRARSGTPVPRAGSPRRRGCPPDRGGIAPVFGEGGGGVAFRSGWQGPGRRRPLRRRDPSHAGGISVRVVGPRQGRPRSGFPEPAGATAPPSGTPASARVQHERGLAFRQKPIRVQGPKRSEPALVFQTVPDRGPVAGRAAPGLHNSGPDRQNRRTA